MASWRDGIPESVPVASGEAADSSTLPATLPELARPASFDVPKGGGISAPTPEALAQLQAEFKGGLASFVAGIPLAAQVGTALFTGGASLAPVLASEIAKQGVDLGREALPKSLGGEGGIKTGGKALVDRSVRAAVDIVTQLPFVAGKYNPLYAVQTPGAAAMGQVPLSEKEAAASGIVQKAANTQAVKALGPTKSQVKEIMGKQGGIDRLGEAALAGPDPIIGPLSSPETMLAKASDQAKSVGQALGNEYRALDNRLPYEGLSLDEHLRLQPDAFLARVRQTAVEAIDSANPYAKAFIKPQIDKLDATLGQLQEVMLPQIQQMMPLKFEQMWQVRQAVDARIGDSFKAMQRGAPIADEVKVLLPLRNAIQDEITSVADAMTARTGDAAAGKVLGELNQRFSALKTVEELLTAKVAAKTAKQSTFNLKDYLGMSLGAATGSIFGPVGSGGGAVVGGATAKLLQSKGHQIAAFVLDKFAAGPPEAVAGLAPERAVWETFYAKMAQQAARLEGGKPIADAILKQSQAMPSQKQLDIEHAKKQLGRQRLIDAATAPPQSANVPQSEAPKSLLTRFQEARTNYEIGSVHADTANSSDRRLIALFHSAGKQVDQLQSLEDTFAKTPPNAGTNTNLFKLTAAKSRIARSALDTRDAIYARG